MEDRERHPDASGSPCGRAATAGPVGYYVHHHGRGHAARFTKIREAWRFESPLVALSELALGGIVLSGDVPRRVADPTAGGALHWAPTGDPALARRARQLVGWMADHDPAGCVIDVSVEAALLCRLAGVPTVVVRQHGDRSDRAHELALRSAVRLLAPFPPELEHPGTDRWVVDKTDYAGFVGSGRSPFVGRHAVDAAEDDVVVLWGAGGGEMSTESLRTLCAAVHPRRVIVAGAVAAASAPEGTTADNLIALGWVDDAQRLLTHGPTVVASAGNNTVADAAAAGCPLIVVPQHRPFSEQHRHAESLDAARVAAVADAAMSVDQWRRALRTASVRRAALAGLAVGDGAGRAAAAIARAFGFGTPCDVRHTAHTVASDGVHTPR